MARVCGEMQMEVAAVDAAAGERRVVLPRRAMGVHVVRRFRPPAGSVNGYFARYCGRYGRAARVPQERRPVPAELRAQIEVHLLPVPLPADAPLLDLRLERDLGSGTARSRRRRAGTSSPARCACALWRRPASRRRRPGTRRSATAWSASRARRAPRPSARDRSRLAAGGPPAGSTPSSSGSACCSRAVFRSGTTYSRVHAQLPIRS